MSNEMTPQFQPETPTTGEQFIAAARGYEPKEGAWEGVHTGEFQAPGSNVVETPIVERLPYESQGAYEARVLGIWPPVYHTRTMGRHDLAAGYGGRLSSEAIAPEPGADEKYQS